jgi:hypothetical protein
LNPTIGASGQYVLTASGPRPFFAEVPYYVWGDVNYDSDGDCKHPTDREWSELYLGNRESGESLTIVCEGDNWLVEGSNPAAERAAYFLIERCGAKPFDDSFTLATDWDHSVVWSRAAAVQAAFSDQDLCPFDNNYFFGAWKWVGWFASEFTWGARWIMLSVRNRDPRAVFLCVDWLTEGAHEPQEAALMHALQLLTGLPARSADEWISWFESEGSKLYPKPDFDQWYADLKAKSQF